jgi:hypothetical protein
MDVNQAIVNLVQRVLDGEWDEASESIEDIRQWVNRGGFKPDLESVLKLLGV